jgi:hypothetical protein
MGKRGETGSPTRNITRFAIIYTHQICFLGHSSSSRISAIKTRGCFVESNPKYQFGQIRYYFRYVMSDKIYFHSFEIFVIRIGEMSFWMILKQ